MTIASTFIILLPSWVLTQWPIWLSGWCYVSHLPTSTFSTKPWSQLANSIRLWSWEAGLVKIIILMIDIPFQDEFWGHFERIHSWSWLPLSRPVIWAPTMVGPPGLGDDVGTPWSRAAAGRTGEHSRTAKPPQCNTQVMWWATSQVEQHWHDTIFLQLLDFHQTLFNSLEP